MRPHFKRAIITSILGCGLSFAYQHHFQFDAQAETLWIRTQGGVGEYKKELNAGEKAKLTVHLKSLGDPVQGFQVALRDGTTGKPREVLSSNEHGIVNFAAIEAGVYQIAVEKKPTERGGTSSASVGDIIFTVTPAPGDAIGKP